MLPNDTYLHFWHNNKIKQLEKNLSTVVQFVNLNKTWICFHSLCFSGSWWALLSLTWTRSPWSRSRTGARSTWRRCVWSWRSWRPSDRPSWRRGRRVRTDAASSATTRRTPDDEDVALLWNEDNASFSADTRGVPVVGVHLCIRTGTMRQTDQNKPSVFLPLCSCISRPTESCWANSYSSKQYFTFLCLLKELMYFFFSLVIFPIITLLYTHVFNALTFIMLKFQLCWNRFFKLSFRTKRRTMRGWIKMFSSAAHYRSCKLIYIFRCNSKNDQYKHKLSHHTNQVLSC